MTDDSAIQEPPADRQPAIRTIAMPADANANGDIFGGWMMAQMDLAGAVAAVQRAQGRIVTVAVEAMTFHLPVLVGDLVSCYAEVTRVGRTSLTVAIDAWVQRRVGRHMERVTSGVFHYVAVDEQGKPRPVPPPKEAS
ncbi:MAG TPA: acyl-CoA thioesterase [Dongiaceae bacterium]|nr:acyl-CoA thioesterase [Dongiaceae bacterium]